MSVTRSQVHPGLPRSHRLSLPLLHFPVPVTTVHFTLSLMPKISFPVGLALSLSLFFLRIFAYHTEHILSKMYFYSVAHSSLLEYKLMNHLMSTIIQTAFI